jgi:hypothetical protein
MRIPLAAFALLAAGTVLDTAKADPYRWCADYGGRTGGSNCYFVTLEQCRGAISGMTTGTCRPNGFYDGIPVDGPQPTKRRARARS